MESISRIVIGPGIEVLADQYTRAGQSSAIHLAVEQEPEQVNFCKPLITNHLKAHQTLDAKRAHV